MVLVPLFLGLFLWTQNRLLLTNTKVVIWVKYKISKGAQNEEETERCWDQGTELQLKAVVPGAGARDRKGTVKLFRKYASGVPGSQ